MAIELKKQAAAEIEVLPKTVHSATSLKKKYTVSATYTTQMTLVDIFSDEELEYIVPKNPTPAQLEEAIDKGFRFDVHSTGFLDPISADEYLYRAEEWVADCVNYGADIVLEVRE